MNLKHRTSPPSWLQSIGPSWPFTDPTTSCAEMPGHVWSIWSGNNLHSGKVVDYERSPRRIHQIFTFIADQFFSSTHKVYRDRGDTIDLNNARFLFFFFLIVTLSLWFNFLSYFSLCPTSLSSFDKTFLQLDCVEL